MHKAMVKDSNYIDLFMKLFSFHETLVVSPKKKKKTLVYSFTDKC